MDNKIMVSGFVNKISYIRKYADVFFLILAFGSIYSGFVFVTQIPVAFEGGLLPKLALKIYQYQFYGYLFLAIVKIILEFFEDKKRAFIFCVLLIISCIHYFLSKYSANNYLELVVMAIAANRIKFLNIAKLFLIEEGIMVFLTIFLSIIGVLPNDVLQIEEGRTYYTLGFGSHNVLMIIVFFNSLLIFYILKERKSFFVASFVTLVIGYVTYKVTQSRTSFYIMIIFLLGMFVISVINKKVNEEKKKIVYTKISRMAISIPGLCSVLSFGAVILWNYLAREAVDSISVWGTTMTSRFYVGSKNFAANGFVLPWENPAMEQIRETSYFKFNWLFGGGWDYYSFDNVYLSAFITAGLIGFALILIYMTYLSYKSYKNLNMVMAWMFVCIAFFAIMEGITQFLYNPFLTIAFSDWGDESDKSFLKKL